MWKYGSLDRLEMMYPHPSVVLRQHIWWEEKADGSCTCCYLSESVRNKLLNDKTLTDDAFNEGVLFASRNNAVAEKHMRTAFETTEAYLHVLEILRERPDYYCFGELCLKGISPARFETHEKNYWVGFDIKSLGEVKTDEAYPKTYNPNGWLTIPYTHQTYYQFDILTPKVHGESIHQDLDDLFRVNTDMQKMAQDMNLEGFVAKTTNGIFRWKVKSDRPIMKKIRKCDVCIERIEGRCEATLEEQEKCQILHKPQLPPLPDSEAFGAVDKVFQELSFEDFKNKSISMPLVAEYIKLEMLKHNYGQPIAKNFFYYYNEYLRGKIAEQSMGD